MSITRLNYDNINFTVKKHCPFRKKRCFSDNGVCGLIGSFTECPRSFDNKTIRILEKAEVLDDE